LELRKVGLFGTRFTMQASFYPEDFRRAGMSIITPTATEQDFVHQKYIKELLKGVILAQTRGEMPGNPDRLPVEGGREEIILAGTELPLLLRDSGRPD